MSFNLNNSLWQTNAQILKWRPNISSNFDRQYGTLLLSGGGADLIGSINEPIKMSEPIKMF